MDDMTTGTDAVTVETCCGIKLQGMWWGPKDYERG